MHYFFPFWLLTKKMLTAVTFEKWDNSGGEFYFSFYSILLAYIPLIKKKNNQWVLSGLYLDGTVSFLY